MLELLVALVFLLIVLWIAKAVLSGLGAPAWAFSIAIGVACLIALVLVAQWAGIAVPSLT